MKIAVLVRQWQFKQGKQIKYVQKISCGKGYNVGDKSASTNDINTLHQENTVE